MNQRVQIGVFTAVEDAALVAWLYLVRIGHRIAGVLVLPVGFFVEHVLAFNVKRKLPLTNLQGVPYGPLAINALLETAVWVIWLLLWPHYQFSVAGIGIPAFAIVFLEFALIIEHNLTDNIMHGRPVESDLLNAR